MIIPSEKVEKAAIEYATQGKGYSYKLDGFMAGIKFLEEYFYKYISDLIIENQGLKLYKDNEAERFKELAVEFTRFIKNNPKLVEDSILTALGVDEYDDNYIAPRHFDNFEKLFDKFIKDKHESNI